VDSKNSCTWAEVNDFAYTDARGSGSTSRGDILPVRTDLAQLHRMLAILDNAPEVLLVGRRWAPNPWTLTSTREDEHVTVSVHTVDAAS